MTQRLAAWRSNGRLALPAILLLAAITRLANLTFHSLWLDEAVSANWGMLPLSEMLTRTSVMREDSHPPFSYIVLHGWVTLFGGSELSLRLSSAVTGVILVGIIYALGRAMAGRRVGLLAGFLAAISPYLVWYSQEVRMYILLAVLSTAGFYFLWRGLQDGRRRWWVAYVLAAAASCYTQIIGALLLPLEFLVALLFFPERPRRSLAGVLAVAVAGLAFVPLAFIAWNSSGATSTERVAPTIQTLLTTTPAMLLLRQVPSGWQALAVPALALAIFGLAFFARRDRRAALALALYIVVILGLIYILSISRLPIFGAPYIIVVAPPVIIAVALGIDAIWRRRQAAALAALLIVSVISLIGLRYDWERSIGKEDWRAAAAYLTSHAQAGDVILAVPNYVVLPLRYYYRGQAPIMAPFGSAVQPDAIGPALQDLAKYRTVWLVWSHGEQIDPQGNIRRWLMERLPVLSEQWPHGVEVRELAAQYKDQAPANGAALATFGDRLQLVAAQADSEVKANDNTYHPPSGWVHADLAWQGKPGADLAGVRPLLRVIDSLGRVWGESLQRPTEVWNLFPPSQWQPGQVVRDGYDINMNPKTPPGTYRVQVQALDKDGKPLPVQAAGMPDDRYFVGEVEVK